MFLRAPPRSSYERPSLVFVMNKPGERDPLAAGDAAADVEDPLHQALIILVVRLHLDGLVIVCHDNVLKTVQFLCIFDDFLCLLVCDLSLKRVFSDNDCSFLMMYMRLYPARV